jgi:hypothetical protein
MTSKHNILLALFTWVILSVLAVYQVVDYFAFKNAGRRFTAKDGQALCVRVQVLETNKKPCEYEILPK